jgi:voltage-gated potassium channel
MDDNASRTSSDRFDRWTRAMNVPLLVLAVAFLVVFLLPLYRPGISAGARTTLRVLNVAIWAAFAVDYLARLYLSPQRRAFVRRHIPDLLTLAVPVLRPLRLLRVIGLLSSTGRRAAERRIAGTVSFAVGAVLLLCVISAGLVLDAERDVEGATLTNAQDALWWAATTVTTVGYGDRFPITGEGRLIAVALMLGGIALLGVVTAAIAAGFVQRVQSDDPAEAVGPSLQDLMTEVQQLRSQVQALPQGEPRG